MCFVIRFFPHPYGCPVSITTSLSRDSGVTPHSSVRLSRSQVARASCKTPIILSVEHILVEKMIVATEGRRYKQLDLDASSRHRDKLPRDFPLISSAIPLSVLVDASRTFTETSRSLFESSAKAFASSVFLSHTDSKSDRRIKSWRRAARKLRGPSLASSASIFLPIRLRKLITVCTLVENSWRFSERMLPTAVSLLPCDFFDDCWWIRARACMTWHAKRPCILDPLPP
mmetsp:Transcript_31768/g.51079  ORF Transcript_31768/g.51079 Transcript_31768/m.51079 type:complete len:229 (-) Transcript_31768:3880-4566(-)